MFRVDLHWGVALKNRGGQHFEAQLGVSVGAGGCAVLGIVRGG